MILFVGEQNPYGIDPTMALYPLPAHAAGGRLCSILGISPRYYLKRYKRVNLLTAGAWSPKEAKLAARFLLLSYPNSRFVLLGSKVAGAFGVPFQPFRILRITRRKVSVPTLVLPHPSGRCRIWNDPESTERARRVFWAFTLRPCSECKWEGCVVDRKPGRDFCHDHEEEAIARLFPNHPNHGELYPLKSRYRTYRIRGER